MHSDTYVGYALLRSNLTSHNDADVAKSVEYAKRIKVYPLSQASSPAETVFTEAEGIVFDSTIKYDASFFASLNEIVQREPWLARDKAMIDPLKSLGIDKGKPFSPTASTTKQLEPGVKEAHEWLEIDPSLRKPNTGFPVGQYEVILSVDGKQMETVNFTVK